LAAAKSHLDKAKNLNPNSGKVFNNMGVVNIMEGDFDKAEENLVKAQELGENVNYNMGIVNIVKGEYAKAANLMKSKSCDYNLGLAQLLVSDYSAAEKTLNCAPQDADTYYLLAIVGSRTDNTTMMYENLTKAIAADASLKGTIGSDREFVDYFDQPDFTAIVQ